MSAGSSDGKPPTEMAKAEGKQGRAKTARLLPLEKPRAQCVACGQSGKAMLQCMACDCFYHMKCAAPETKRHMADGVPWLCENCFTGQ